jgi:hypothetical protein
MRLSTRPQTHSPPKFFRCGEFAAPSVKARTKARASEVPSVRTRRLSAQRDALETGVSSALLLHTEFFARDLGATKIFRRMFRRRCGFRSGRAGGRGLYTQN